MALALVWKPPGEGSQQFLGRLKREWKLGGKAREGIGHTGTLDPFAEGLLCVGTHEGTKLLHPLTGLSKSYRARFVFGVSSDTLDATGVVRVGYISNSNKLEEFFKVSAESYLASKLGAFEQIPPQFSAVHIDGKRAYDWAREGVTKELKARQAELLAAKSLGARPLSVEEFLACATRVGGAPELSLEADLQLWEWQVELTVSSGTYIRSFARDWCIEIVGAPGLLSELVRTRIGPWELSQGQTQAWLDLSGIEKLFDIERLSADSAEALKRYGRWEPRSCEKACLLLDENNTPVAWIEAPSGRIGRVFLSDPLQAH